MISKLSFTPSAEDDEMVVSCEAINEVMDEGIKAEAVIDIICKLDNKKRKIYSICFPDAPRVTIEDENKTVIAGDKVTITCLIDANPMNLTQVHWYHNDDVIDVEDERFESEMIDVVSLTIIPVTPADVGDYHCAVENIAGQGSSLNYLALSVLCEYSQNLKISFTIFYFRSSLHHGEDRT